MADGVRERHIVAQPIAIGGGKVIASPFQFYLDGTDNLRIEGWNTAIGASLEVHGRVITETGAFQAFREVLPLTADRIVARRDFSPVRGYITNMVVVALGVNCKIGQTFARVSIIRGFTGATIVLGVLLQGYVTSQQALGWPGSPLQHSLEGGGYTRFVDGTQPAAGAQITEVVPTGARWQVLRVLAGLQADGVAANRFIRFAFVAGALFNAHSMNVNAQTAGQNVIYACAPNLPFAFDAVSLVSMQPLPQDSELLDGEELQTYVVNMQAGDQWSAPRLYVREWLEIE